MSDLPNTLNDNTTLHRWIVWAYFAVTAMLLTWVCMNMVLAVTLGAFNDANTILMSEKAEREEEEKAKADLEEEDAEDSILAVSHGLQLQSLWMIPTAAVS